MRRIIIASIIGAAIVTAGIVAVSRSSSEAAGRCDGPKLSAKCPTTTPTSTVTPTATPTATLAPIPSPTPTPTVVAGSPDLSVALSQSLAEVRAGFFITYTLTATNVGDTAGNYIFELYTPDGFQFPSSSSTPSYDSNRNSCNGGPAHVVCSENGTPYAPGESRQLAITGLYDGTVLGSLTVRAVGNSNGNTDSNPNNDVATVTTTVAP